MPDNTHMSSEFDYFNALFINSKVNAILNLDTDGHILAANAAFKNYFGYEDVDLLGKHFEILFTEEDRQQQKPAKELISVLLTGQGTDKNYMLHKDGSITWVSGESILVQNNTGGKTLLKIIQDIHEQKEYEHSLARSNDFNESILKSIDDLVFVVDESMQVIKFNPAFANRFGRINADTQLSNNFVSLITPFDSSGEWIAVMLSVLSTSKPVYNRELEISVSDQPVVYEVSCQLMKLHQDSSKRLLVTAHDISSQKQGEREKEDIMGFVAHELRNPLTNIILSNDLVMGKLKEHITGDIAKVLERSNQNIFRLNKLIAELYDAAKAGSGHFILETTNVDFDSMIMEAINISRPASESDRIQLHGQTNAQVRGDRYRLTQVVTNYLSNAMKYSDKNLPIVVELNNDGRNITVAVKDKGKGISANDLPFVFDRFYRVEKTGKTEGIGLGLFLSRRIIGLHNGKVWAESKEGEGSVFYFSIPL